VGADDSLTAVDISMLLGSGLTPLGLSARLVYGLVGVGADDSSPGVSVNTPLEVADGDLVVVVSIKDCPSGTVVVSRTVSVAPLVLVIVTLVIASPVLLTLRCTG
jgi:hypothetical protein